MTEVQCELSEPLNENVGKQVSEVSPITDQPWSWVIAIGALVTNFLSPFVIHAFGLLFLGLLQEESSSKISWIFNICQVLWCLTSLFVPTFSNAFGWRRISFVGGLLISLSTMLSAAAQNADFLFLTFSLLHGIGAGICVSTSYFIIPQYFVKRRGALLGMVKAALSLGEFVAPLLVLSLLEKYGQQWSILIIGAILLNICVAAMLFSPPPNLSAQDPGLIVKVEEEAAPAQFLNKEQEGNIEISAQKHNKRPAKIKSDQKQTKPKMVVGRRFYDAFVESIKNISMLKNPKVFIVTFGPALTCVICINALMLIPFLTFDKGHSAELAGWGLSISAICNMVARLLVSALTDVISFSTKWLFIASCVIISASLYAITLVNDELAILITFGVLGFGIGSKLCLTTLIIIEFMGVDLFPTTYGVLGFILSIMFLTLGPLIGVIRDATQNFNFCLNLLSGVMLIPIVLLLMMPLAIAYDNKRKKITFCS